MCNLFLVEWYNSFIWKYEIPTLKIQVKLFFQEHATIMEDLLRKNNLSFKSLVKVAI